MLPAAHRLRRSVDFDRAVRGGVRAGGPTLVVHMATDPEGQNPPRVGFVVSKAVGNAVHRNLVKRRLRAAVAAGLDCLPENTVTVIRALPSAAGATYATLDDDVAGGVRRAQRKLTRRVGGDHGSPSLEGRTR